MPADFAARRSALRQSLIAKELDSLLVTDLLNIRYLTGFTGSNAALIVRTGDSSPDESRTV
ncbi:MAG: aminopeptidase P family N-terminal domain-containing protein, partial [Rhodococcus sp. (in: high G+C Gram-positive bacteria)]